MRERVIVEIEDLEQAAKIEETVGTGYCETIKDNLTHWIAVEEDIIESYVKLSEKIGSRAGRRIAELGRESQSNVTSLRELLKSFEILGQQRKSRTSMLRDMRAALS